VVLGANEAGPMTLFRQALMTSEFTENLSMLQWTLNEFLEAGSDEVRRSDIHIWLDPDSEELCGALREWEASGFITILTDPRHCRAKDVCLRILKPISAFAEQEDSDADA